MKHFLLFLGLLLCLPVPSFSQGEWTCRKEISLRFGGDRLLGSEGCYVWNGQVEYSWRKGKSFALGLGTGAWWPSDASFVGIPLVLRVSYGWYGRRVVPYVAVQCSAPLYIDDYYITVPQLSTLCVSPAVGVKVPVTSWMAFDISAGYTRYGFCDGGKSALGIKAGISFGLCRKKQTDIGDCSI